MVHNPNDLNDDGTPVLDQDLEEGYNGEMLPLTTLEKVFIWSIIGLCLTMLILILYHLNA